MKPSITRLRSRRGRRLFVGGLAVLLALSAPICQALCLGHGAAEQVAGAAVMPLEADAGVHADCHGRTVDSGLATDSPQVDADRPCCPDHDAAFAGERSDVPPATLLAYLPPSALVLPARLPGRFAARDAVQARSPGPPLRLLTLRFLE